MTSGVVERVCCGQEPQTPGHTALPAHAKPSGSDAMGGKAGKTHTTKNKRGSEKIAPASIQSAQQRESAPGEGAQPPRPAAPRGARTESVSSRHPREDPVGHRGCRSPHCRCRRMRAAPTRRTVAPTRRTERRRPPEGRTKTSQRASWARRAEGRRSAQRACRQEGGKQPAAAARSPRVSAGALRLRGATVAAAGARAYVLTQSPFKPVLQQALPSTVARGINQLPRKALPAEPPAPPAVALAAVERVSFFLHEMRGVEGKHEPTIMKKP